MFSALAIAGVAILCVSLPLWFPWVARPLLGMAGVRYARYERDGYQRFTLHGVSYRLPPITFRAERIEGFVPTAWLWRLGSSRGTSEPFARVITWSAEYASAPVSSAAVARSASAYARVQALDRALRTIRRWLPVAVCSNGRLDARGFEVLVPSLTWTNGALEAHIQPRPGHPETITATLIPARPFQLQIRSESLPVQASLILSNSVAGLDIHQAGLWWSNHVGLEARFGREGPLPQTASLQAPDIHLPASMLGFPAYGEIAGSAMARWQRDQFTLELSARVSPESASQLPPLQIDLQAKGSSVMATISSAKLSCPWFGLELSTNANVYYSAPWFREPAALRLTADLGRQPWLPLKGTLNGEAEVRPGTNNLPSLAFHLSGPDIAATNLRARSLDLNATLEWPHLNIAKIYVTLPEGSTASVSGIVDLPARLVSAGQLQFAGQLPNQWLPSGYAVQSASVSAQFHGPFDALEHTGHVDLARLTIPGLRQLDMAADWSAQWLNLRQVKLAAYALPSTLVADGAVEIAAERVQVRLETLTLSTNQQPVLALARPCEISASRQPSATQWQLAATPFQWEGPGGRLQLAASVEWPRQGSVRLDADRLSSALASGFVKTELPTFAIQSLDAFAGWTNGPATFELNLAAEGLEGWRLTPTGAPSLTLETKLAGNAAGIMLSKFLVTSPTQAVAEAHGSLPIAVNPDQPGMLVFEPEKPLALSASARPQAFFWDELANWSGARLVDPTLDLNLAGTWQAPRGAADLQARQIQLPGLKGPLPSLDDLRLRLELDQTGVRLREGRCRVQGQELSLTGEIPLGQKYWAALPHLELPEWNQATARLHAQNVQLAAFQPLFPGLLASQGRLALELSLLPGRKWTGELTVDDARTTPLGDLGPMRNIELQLRLADDTLRLERASAELGGAPVSLAGQVDLKGSNWLRGAIPPFQLELHGTNVALSRQPESVVRGDLSLAVLKTNTAPPLVSGLVRLRDSYFLSDLRGLIPGKITVPQERPPYFSIDIPELVDWRLDVAVNGVRFLKVRSPLFVGDVSASLSLKGTLKDPIALGDLKIDSGFVRFPFASLQVQQGLITLDSQDPYHPHVLLTGSSRQFGYDVRLAVTGTADAPVILFTSNPPLSPEQILVMVTSGQVPQGALSLTPQQRAQTVALFLARGPLAKLGLGDEAEPRLMLHSGEEISQQGRPTYRVEYRLSNRWSLEGEYDRFGDYNAGFKYLIYSK